jgi:subtilisin-like proprotein convertase family protein
VKVPSEPHIGTGSFRLYEPLSAFDGEHLNATRTLKIVDNAGADTGTLNSWSLTMVGFDCS